MDQAVANQTQENLAQESMGFTQAGAQKASAMLLAQNKQEAAIRVFVKSGGCSGYSYGMAIDDKTLEGDHLIEDKGVRLVVDPASWQLLKGSEIDYVENMMGGGFNVQNPNATSACGCGHSFRTDGKASPDSEGAASCH